MPSFLKTNRIQKVSQMQSYFISLRNVLWGDILLQALHNVLHIVGVDVVSFQQTTVAGALHSKLYNTGKHWVKGRGGGFALQ